MKKKMALVLEGGGLRGIYTAGVLDKFLDENIEFDMVVGVSAGALFGCNYPSKQKGRALRYNKKYCGDKRYMSFNSWIKTGNFINKEFAFEKLVYELDPFDFNTFKNSKTKFYAVVTNTKNGKAEYKLIDDMDNKDQMEYMRASGAIPCISKMVEVNNEKYLDGAIGDSIPVKWAMEQGYDKIVVVTTRPEDYRMKYKKRTYAKVMYRKYPEFLKAFLNRYKMYNDTIDLIKELENDKKILVIRPSKYIKISRLEKNPEIIQKQYDLGYSDCSNMIKDIKNYGKN